MALTANVRELILIGSPFHYVSEFSLLQHFLASFNHLNSLVESVSELYTVELGYFLLIHQVKLFFFSDFVPCRFAPRKQNNNRSATAPDR